MQLSTQAYRRDITGSVAEHDNKASRKLFAGRGSCLQFVKNSTSSVKHNKVKRNEMMPACSEHLP